MPEIKLTQEEQDDLNIKFDVMQRTTQQITTLATQRDQAMKDMNWIWKAVRLGRGKSKKLPEKLVNSGGDLSVTFKDGVASWGGEAEEKES